ncbi:hypothetical protein HZC00_00445 [Candidatus Kaiserbacteria bacterium]|nr:hypothetical protein [Candidatus Kaiserbacteria bacterium]
METGIQSSFIPKEAGKVASVSRPISGGAGLPELLILAAVILLIASAALAGGVFLYQQFLSGQATSKAAQLKRAEAAFEPSLIQQLTRLDDRMHTADLILSSHLAPSVFFDSLDQATLTTVSFSNLSLDANDPRHINIKMTGVARSVNSIALQADLFSKNSVIYDPIFAGIDQQADGVHFNLTALVNMGAINYAQMINGVQQSAAPIAAPVPPTPGSAFTTPGSAPDANKGQ